VLMLESYASQDEAVGLSNATSFGLAASVWSRDTSRALSVARELKAGTVWVNGYNRSYAEMPSGGMRMSGLGRTRGLEGLEQFTELKHIHLSLQGAGLRVLRRTGPAQVGGTAEPADGALLPSRSRSSEAQKRRAACSISRPSRSVTIRGAMLLTLPKRACMSS
jgi:hypothetical protein